MSILILAIGGGVQADVDFGDHSSQTLTSKAWQANDAGDYDAVLTYANKCIEMYQTQALEMQAGLTEAPTGEPEHIHTFWALNDVGTCYYIKGMVLEAQGKAKEAATAYKFLVEKLPFAQCWDTQGWFWKPADAAKARIKALEYEALE